MAQIDLPPAATRSPASRDDLRRVPLVRPTTGLFALFLAALSLAACGGTSRNSALASMDSAGMQRTVERLAADMQLPGVVVIVKTPNGDFKTAYGVTSYKGSNPTGYDQKVRIGSVTKSWVGTVILQQVQEGKVKLEDAVSQYWPGVPNGDNITIEQLLTMRSRLFNYTELPLLEQAIEDEPLKVWTQQQLLDLAFAQKPYTEEFHYSNTNTILLGLIAQKLDGDKPLAEVFANRLWKPTNVQGTSFPATTSNDMPKPYSRGYTFRTNGPTGEQPSRETSNGVNTATLAPSDETDSNPSWAWAAGAGISTADDLVQIAAVMVGGGLLSPELQAMRLASIRPVNPSDPASAGYGWGLAKFGPLYGHTGELPGYNTFMGHDPVNHVTVVVWTNLAPAADGRAPATTIARSLIGAVYARAP